MGEPRKARILVVDDDPDCADTVTNLLRLNGHQAEAAYSAAEAAAAVSRASDSLPGLIVSRGATESGP